MLIIALAGTELLPAEREWLGHAATAGVTLFSRNFKNRLQVTGLIKDIRDASPRPLLVCVDQEGGTVQRFRGDFTDLPPLAALGAMYGENPAAATELAEEHAWLMASEMRAIDVDLSFAPVVDLARGNRAIGTRALDADPATVGALGAAYVRGMRLAGMAATVKHFPGHGSVAADTHVETAIDPRPFEEIRAEDLAPFREAFAAGADAVMMAHVVYRDVDALPAGYSARWIRDILRTDMGFRGVILSDDIGMFGAVSAGPVSARIDAHLEAGCDLVLACQPETIPVALDAMEHRDLPGGDAVARLAGRAAGDWTALSVNPQRGLVAARLAALASGTVPA